MSSDHDMLVIRWRRGQAALKIVGTAHHLLPKAGR